MAKAMPEDIAALLMSQQEQIRQQAEQHKAQQKKLQEQLDAQTEFQQRMLEMFSQVITSRTTPVSGHAGTSAVPPESEGHKNLEPTFETIINGISEFRYDPDNDVTFEAWYNRYEDLFSVDVKDWDESEKVRLLLRKLHTSVHEKYANFILPNDPRKATWEDTITTLTKLFGPKQSLFSIRYNLLKLVKKPRDDIITYAGVVNRECERFKLGDLKPDQFKCLIFIAGLQSPAEAEYRLRLLNVLDTNREANLEGLVEEYQRLTTLKTDSKMLENANRLGESVQAVVSHKARPGGQSFKMKQQHNFAKQNNGATPPAKPKFPCWLCGAMHFMRNCEYANHTCSSCGETGHKEGYCGVCKQRKGDGPRSRSRNSSFRHKKQSQSKGMHCINAVEVHGLRKYAHVQIGGTPLTLQIDSASDITLISKEAWKRIGEPPLQPTDKTAFGVTDHQNPVTFLGQFECVMHYDKAQASGTCFVTEHYAQNLLGLDFISKLDLWNLKEIKGLHQEAKSIPVSELRSSPSLFKDQFSLAELQRRFPTICDSTLGHCKIAKATLRLKENVGAVFRHRRPVPFAALESVEKELDRLEQLGVISKADYSNWAAPIVCVKKASGALRICADFSTGLNDALELHQYPLPLPEDIFAILNGGQFFSQIDFADAYLQVEMDESSKELLTINTHRGLYRYNRLPFGVKSAPGIFQQIMDTMLSGLDGVVAYLDDLIIVGKSEAEHATNLNAVLKRIEESGFHIKPEKCSFFMPRVKYLGFIIDREGRHPDPEKIRAIQSMPVPKDVSQLRSFLGLINYYGTFVKEMRDLRAPLDTLLKKDVPWQWSKQCQNAFERAKKILSSDLLLTHFDPQQEIVVAADASNNGIGAVILHRYANGSEKAVAHASRSLTTTERKYSQIEKEALGLVFAVKKFHRMVHGRKFTLLTDHKPLTAIFGSKKGIPVCTANRLQRWATTLIGYDFHIEYRSTNSFGQADALSRLIADSQPEDEEFVVASVNVDDDVRSVFAETIRALPVTAEMIAKATKENALLQKVMKFLKTEWPAKPSAEIASFFHRRESLSVQNECLLLGERVVIPEDLREPVLRQLHVGHPGIVRMKALARSYVYWPGIDTEIEDVVKSCWNCRSVAKAPVKTMLASWPTEERPWSRVHIDYAGPIEGHYFLVAVDSSSKWPEICMTDRTTTTATLDLLHPIFTRFGMPEVLVSDNGTQFASAEFEEYCKRNGIKHIRSPPYHPQSNGQAERFVDTFKRGLLKIRGEGKSMTIAEALQTFLQSYRSTPNAALGNNQSPAEVLLGRRMRTSLDLMKPDFSHPKKGNEAMEYWFNRHHGTKYRAFIPGTLVYTLKYQGNLSSWVPGHIMRRRGKVTYDVAVNGEIWKRHANQIHLRHVSDNPALETLLDTFGLEPLKAAKPDVARSRTNITEAVTPTEAVIKDQHQPAAVVNADTTVSSMVPAPRPILRRSERQIKKKVQFSPQPSLKSYHS